MQLQQCWTFVLSKITWLVDQPLTVSTPVIPQNIWNEGMLDCAFRVGSNSQLQTWAVSELSREGLAGSQLRSLNLSGADLVFLWFLRVLCQPGNCISANGDVLLVVDPNPGEFLLQQNLSPQLVFPGKGKPSYLSSRLGKWPVSNMDKAWKRWNHIVLARIDSICKRRMGKNYLFWWRNYKNTWKREKVFNCMCNVRKCARHTRNQVKEKLYILETCRNPALGTSLIHLKTDWAWRGTGENNTH